MATKEQERKALEQIKGIVNGLGADSYIGMAFEGCFEIAEDNIENDWGCSMKQRAESAERKFMDAMTVLENAEKSNERMTAANSDLQGKVAALENQCEDVRGRLAIATEAAKKAEEKAVGLVKLNAELTEKLENSCNDCQMVTALEAEVKAKELEIIRLKARLFDLLDK